MHPPPRCPPKGPLPAPPSLCRYKRCTRHRSALQRLLLLPIFLSYSSTKHAMASVLPVQNMLPPSFCGTKNAAASVLPVQMKLPRVFLPVPAREARV
eukprot:2027124-Rhodomonas_salina.1